MTNLIIEEISGKSRILESIAFAYEKTGVEGLKRITELLTDDLLKLIQKNGEDPEVLKQPTLNLKTVSKTEQEDLNDRKIDPNKAENNNEDSPFKSDSDKEPIESGEEQEDEDEVADHIELRKRIVEMIRPFAQNEKLSDVSPEERIKIKAFIKENWDENHELGKKSPLGDKKAAKERAKLITSIYRELLEEIKEAKLNGEEKEPVPGVEDIVDTVNKIVEENKTNVTPTVIPDKTKVVTPEELNQEESEDNNHKSGLTKKQIEALIDEDSVESIRNTFVDLVTEKKKNITQEEKEEILTGWEDVLIKLANKSSQYSYLKKNKKAKNGKTRRRNLLESWYNSIN